MILFNKILESKSSSIFDDDISNDILLCGTESLPFTSSGSYLRLQFISDSSIVDMGFSLKYYIGKIAYVNIVKKKNESRSKLFTRALHTAHMVLQKSDIDNS